MSGIDKSMEEASVDEAAARLRGFGPVGILAILVILAGNLIVVPLSAILVLVWAHLSRTPWRSLGFTAPKSWAGTIALGLLLGIVFKLGMKAIVMPLLGAPPINARYHYLAGNAAALPWMLYLIVVGAGFGEETLFRGFLFERLEKLLGSGKAALAAIVLLTSTLFAVAHYPDQGLPGVQQAAVTGLVFGTLFAVTKRIWLPMVAHAAFDLTAVALIYWNWEAAVAQLFFR
jgi:uncharacterized protein